jgi:hypothetical protein
LVEAQSTPLTLDVGTEIMVISYTIVVSEHFVAAAWLELKFFQLHYAWLQLDFSSAAVVADFLFKLNFFEMWMPSLE